MIDRAVLIDCMEIDQAVYPVLANNLKSRLNGTNVQTSGLQETRHTPAKGQRASGLTTTQLLLGVAKKHQVHLDPTSQCS